MSYKKYPPNPLELTRSLDNPLIFAGLACIYRRRRDQPVPLSFCSVLRKVLAIGSGGDPVLAKVLLPWLVMD